MRFLFQRFYLLMFGCLMLFLVIGMYLRHNVYNLSMLQWAVTFISIALLISIAAYPLARRISKRLQRLQETVAAFGDGQLQRRARVEGHDEVAALATGFNIAADRIESLVVAHRTLLANASHELRTPLTRIRLGAELLMQKPEPHRLTELNADLHELDDLLEEILLASRLDATDPTPERNEAIDLPALLAEECARYKACELDCAAVLDSGAIPVLIGDPRLLRRLVRNLLENARRHGVAPTVVTLSRQQAEFILQVSDAGQGVPNEDRERIFEPFFRSRSSDENKGSGLGLSLVRKIARRHGGDAICRSTDAPQSQFRINLPLPDIC